jgi:hypothetical protein
MKWIAKIRYRLTGWCGHGCGFVAPYGFVPEADCPIHDSEVAPVERVDDVNYQLIPI